MGPLQLADALLHHYRTALGHWPGPVPDACGQLLIR